jgi:hypothetical protein
MLDEALREAVRSALVAELPGVLAELRERSRLVPIKAASLPYRVILDAEKRGVLPVYRVGHSSFVDERELEALIRAEGLRREPERAAEPDAVGELLELDRERRAKRKGRAA